ncbi:SDR family NAD(P)-dependent oxidoreductase [Pseudomonas sp. CCI3.2]|uniref:SDR family NAD(P)-dependent oxidoreductase n=1 Tax=unclassified Pseudomonas TaxID=196821 RepID=UPI002AC9304D|nr:MULTISPECIES: SDR family NAD(P)-dependent oxidoreductase [unclassified Pseudomonas]MEB0077293.1 SDR family NAD(P)-dependent oxidoreductase [Pseudomonas sp. MH10out]MEB0091376.1 SDR family NAD(P)-dependent oxidoreductase [Pseudomonas sp. CCI4.2]MEB0104090.1 SDR family NAD(P)-dependent oxidoreductase [Pseudomonas sp. CCI3.2]MEB0129244.1 SDR family NAD(P)-dependent oxidoreductase [Pseudomonas sp. CCI2.4]MEB0157504.1 SDR family NAD(P)-dependent oxidoreductase [Pseudomonas sp. AH2 (2023)]
MQNPNVKKTILLIGASRGLGFAMVEEYLKRGWQVIATGREGATEKLIQLAKTADGALDVETVDITIESQIAALRVRLDARRLDVLFVNAGVKNDDRETIADVSTEEFVRVMVTNSLSPMRVIEALQDLVQPTGTLGVMSSGQGSLTNNTNGNYEVYRGSKAALNMFMRSFAARHQEDAKTLLLMAPGWVRTDMGGPEARLSIGESIPNLVNTIEAHEGRSGLHYLDYLGRIVPW